MSLDLAARAWSRRRRELNHDWLAGSYLQKLLTVRNAIHGAVAAPERGRSILASVIDEWRREAPTVARLSGEFLAAMSPTAVIDEWPMGACPEATRSWLRTLTEARWRERNDIDRLVSALDQAVTATNQTAEALAVLLREAPGPLKESAAEPVVAHVRACVALSEAISALPRRVVP